MSRQPRRPRKSATRCIPPARLELAEHGISCKGKTARQMTRADYDAFDLIVGMDDENLDGIYRILSGESGYGWGWRPFDRDEVAKADPEDKVHLLLDWSARPRDIADPWYSGNFDATFDDVLEGCSTLLDVPRLAGRCSAWKSEIPTGRFTTKRASTRWKKGSRAYLSGSPGTTGRAVSSAAGRPPQGNLRAGFRRSARSLTETCSHFSHRKEGRRQNESAIVQTRRRRDDRAGKGRGGASLQPQHDG